MMVAWAMAAIFWSELPWGELEEGWHISPWCIGEKLGEKNGECDQEDTQFLRGILKAG